MTLPKGPKGIHQVSCHDFKLKQPLPFRHPHTWFCRRKCWALIRLRFICGVPTLRGAITVLFCVVVVEAHDVFQMIKVQLQSFVVVQAVVTFSTHVCKISLHIHFSISFTSSFSTFFPGHDRITFRLSHMQGIIMIPFCPASNCVKHYVSTLCRLWHHSLTVLDFHLYKYNVYIYMYAY